MNEDGEPDVCLSFSIPENDSDVHVVDLLKQQDNGFSSLEFGVYRGDLVAPDDSCGVQIEKPKLMVEWTVSPAEIAGGFSLSLSTLTNIYVHTLPLSLSRYRIFGSSWAEPWVILYRDIRDQRSHAH